MLCFAGSLWLIAFYWAPGLLKPGPMGVVAGLIWFSVPFQYAMTLTQTHVLFFAMTVGALILAERRRPGWAGFLLACAAAVKLTPGVIVVYWLVTRRWKAAFSMVAWFGVLGIVTWIAVGANLMAAYLQELHRISQVLLVTMNNQSLAAWWMGGHYPAGTMSENTILPLPPAVRWTSFGLMVALTAVGGMMDWQRKGRPLGALVGLVAATVFAPIAWTHYSIVLVAPLMVLWQENRREKRWAVWVATIVMVLLTYRPLAADVLGWKLGHFAVVRSEFFACVVCLGTVIYVAWCHRWENALEPECGDPTRMSGIFPPQPRSAGLVASQISHEPKLTDTRGCVTQA